MNGTALITGIREDFRYGLQHAEIFISNHEADTFKATFLEPYKKGTPAVFILFHAFGSTDNLTAAVFIYTDGNKDGTFWISPPQLRLR